MRFRDDEAVRRLAQRLAASGGRRLDDASPYVDVRLADGTRFHAVLAPVSRPGTLLSLRVPERPGAHARRPGRAGTVTEEGRGCWPRWCGTGWRSWSAAAPAPARPRCSQRCCRWSTRPSGWSLVEDASELRPDHPHVVGLEARPANIEGAGGDRRADLVRQALRMRPDRLVVGEVRGAEVVDLLAALNTGHEGGCGTLHANSAVDVAARVEALALAAGLGRGGRAQPARLGASTSCSTSRRAATAAAVVRQVAVPVRAPDGLVTLRARRRVRRRRRRPLRPGRRPARAAPRAMSPLPLVAGLAAGAARGCCCDRPARGRPAGAAPAPVVAAAPAGRRGARWWWGRRVPAVLLLLAALVAAGRPVAASTCADGAPAAARTADGCWRPASCSPSELAAGQPTGSALDRAAAAWPPLGRWPRRSGSAATPAAALARPVAAPPVPATSGWSPPPGRSPTAPGDGLADAARPGRRDHPRPARRPGGWSRVSSRRPGPRRGWSPGCRCSRC